jgi:hypothetical protein
MVIASEHHPLCDSPGIMILSEWVLHPTVLLTS